MKPQYVLPFERPIVEMEEQLAKLESQPGPTPTTLESIRNMRVEISKMKRDIFEHLDPWQTVQVARHQDRPQSRDYIELVCDEFVELHGDRAFGDDRAINAGFAKIDDYKVLLIGQHKGRTLKERGECFYGCAHPEGYRKALLKMELAAKFKLPIVCLIDTPGAYPGIGAEERGQAYTIAVNLRDMSMLPVPIICIVIGESATTSGFCNSPTIR
jgi:acetyl-CoA carboxylase carboxyl transferase subunit alpha